MTSNGNKPLVLITHALPAAWVEALARECEIEMGPADSSGFSPELLDRLDQAEGLLTMLMDKVGEDILQRSPRLKVVSNMAVGFDNIYLAACTRRRIAVGNTPGVLTEATADLSMALLLAAARRLPEAAADARAGKWKNWAPAGWLGADLNGGTLGIIGMGKIGLAVAKRAFGFGLKIVYTNQTTVPEAEHELKARKTNLDDLLRTSDFISLHVPLTPETRHMIDESAFRKMKSSAILINAARGPVVDTHALVMALSEGWIAGAALDVTDPEPLPPNHLLYTLENALIVPHIGSATQGTRRKMADMACDNIIAGLSGLRLPYCVNPEIYQDKGNK